MFQPNGSTIECDTCAASNTSACGECVVSYVLANDAGPIEYVPTPEPVELRPRTGTIESAVQLFVRAGLVDEPVVYVSVAEFEHGSVGAATGAVLVR